MDVPGRHTDGCDGCGEAEHAGSTSGDGSRDDEGPDKRDVNGGTGSLP